MKKLHVGTMGWSYEFWRDQFYPEDSKKLLTEYAKNFDTVEIDNTFYRIPSRDNVIKWKEETPDDFIFTARRGQRDGRGPGFPGDDEGRHHSR